MVWYGGASNASVRAILEYGDGMLPGRCPFARYDVASARLLEGAAEIGKKVHLGSIPTVSIAPTGEPLYVDYWMGEQQIRASKLRFRRRVESLDDANVNGHYRGWFVYPMIDTLPWPQWDWDPDVVFKDMRLVARFGFVGVWHGEMTRPQTRAGSLFSKVKDYIYKQDGDDWKLVSDRLEEVVVQLPAKVDAGVELGNAYLRQDRRAEAVVAYRRLLTQDKIPVEPSIAAQLKAQIARIEAAPKGTTVAPMRNPWLE